MRRALPLLVLLSGCSLTEERYDDAAARSWCSALKECDERRFWTTYDGGSPECRERVSEEVLRIKEGDTDAVVKTSCTWREPEAQDCLAQLEEATCTQVASTYWFQDCTRTAWDCIAIIPGAE